MYINFWYPAGLSTGITATPVRRRMLGQDFVLWRDSAGKVHCLANTCCHRGGALAGGKIVEDEVQCPYHGWRFNRDGQCTRIPSLGIDAALGEILSGRGTRYDADVADACVHLFREQDYRLL